MARFAKFVKSKARIEFRPTGYYVPIVCLPRGRKVTCGVNERDDTDLIINSAVLAKPCRFNRTLSRDLASPGLSEIMDL